MMELITTKEAAFLLKCDPSTINSYVRKGRLKTAQDGSKRLFERDTILNFKRPTLIQIQKTRKNFSIKRQRSNPNFNRNIHSQNIPSVGLDKSDFKKIVEKWRVNIKDNSSADIQIGIYTEKIIQLEKAMKNLSIEDPTLRKMRYILLRHVGERRKLLHYLKISDFKRYRRALKLISREAS